MKAQKKLTEVMNIMHNALDQVCANDDTASLKRFYKDRFQATYKLIHEFLADNTEVKNGPLKCREFVDTDPVRAQLTCVYHDPEEKVAVATNAHVLYVSEEEYIDTPTEWHLRTPYGDPTDIVGIYPKWKAVVPPENPTANMERVDFNVRADLVQAIKDCTAEAKIDSGMKTVKEGKGRIRLSEEAPVWCDLVYAGFIARAGLEGWYTVIKKGATVFNRAFVKRWDGQILLVMPVMVDEDQLTKEETERGWCIVSDR